MTLLLIFLIAFILLVGWTNAMNMLAGLAMIVLGLLGIVLILGTMVLIIFAGPLLAVI